MNRILQAEVILTLTAEQVRGVLLAMRGGEAACLSDGYGELSREFGELVGLLRDQCVKQGVQL